jgi:two-component system, chemotaxis family, sensor kinase CheA
MERSGYLDLYVTEAHEYMRTLQRGLLTLGEGAGRSALEEAFRAAHTLKGMSALMGYRAVGARAHQLEDRREEV